MAEARPRFEITDLTGGRNGFDSPWRVPVNQCVEAYNVDFQTSPLGAKRFGAAAVNPSFSAGGPFSGAIGSLLRHIPGDDETAAELWASDLGSAGRLARMAGASTFADVTLKDNLAAAADAINVFGASMSNGFFFLTYKSAQNRTYVWDPTLSKVRRVGLATPAAPTAATLGGAGLTFSRVYRVRFVDISGSDTRRRSEAGATVSISITDDSGVQVTRPTAASEDETHWEVEAADTTAGPFYRLAQVAIATTTYNDTAATIPTTNLSAVDGINNPPPGAKFVLGTDARVLWAGHYGVTGGYTRGKVSRVWWSSVDGSNDVGDWERIQTGNYIDVDGAITAIAGPLNGVIYVFGYRRIWRLVPTGNASEAYVRYSVSHSIGCIRQQTIVYGEDEQGNPCIYFISTRGPYRLTPDGLLQFVGTDITDIWQALTLNDTTYPSHGVYHATRREVWYWLASGSNPPSNRARFDVSRGRPENSTTVRCGWTMDNGGGASAYASVMFSKTLGASMSRDLKPFVAQSSGTGRLWKCDDTTVYTDGGSNYSAVVTTRVYTTPVLGQRIKIYTPVGLLITSGTAGADQIGLTMRTRGQMIWDVVDFENIQQVYAYSTSSGNEDTRRMFRFAVENAGIHAFQLLYGNNQGVSDTEKFFGLESLSIPYEPQDKLSAW